jgi:hypothetical protein
MRIFLAVLVLGIVASPALAQTSFPMITHTIPVAVQRGTVSEIVVHGRMDFQGAYQVLFQGSGITAEVLAETPAKKIAVSQVKLKVTVAPDAALGVRDFRIATRLGVSSIGQLVIVDAPVVAEAAKNDTPAEAQALKLPCVVAGRLEKTEDVDYYKVHAEAGQTLTFEVYCARLQDRIHDLQKHAKPMLVLYDADGRELASNDHFYFADPLLSYTAPKSGFYTLQVRESTYDGDPRWVYALLATNRPYVSHVYPMAGNPGRMMEVEPISPLAPALSPGRRGLKEGGRASLRPPAEPGVHQVQLDLDGIKTNPVAFIVSSLPQFLEQEPNDTEATANRITVPCGINGRFDHQRDLDHFVFAARKGKAIRFEVHARRFGTVLCSAAHAVLEVRDLKGTVLAANDQTHGQEASLVFTPPTDGDYVLRVRDLNSQGGSTFIYYVEADWDRPDFALRCDPDKAMIGPGSSTAWYVHVARSGGFSGPVKVQVKGLPPGVTCSPLTIPPRMTQGLVVLTAAPEAKPAAANVVISGAATIKGPAGKEEVLIRRATPNEEIYLPGGGRGLFDVGLQTVAVTDPSDIERVEVSPRQVVLRPGGEAKIEVIVHRGKQYTKSVSLDMVLQHLGRVYGDPLPPGVMVVAGKSKTLLGPGSRGHIVLQAAPTAAPIENVPVSVLAHVSINFVVKISYSSPPILLSVRKE